MPMPRRLARFNRTATNRIMRALAGWAPGFAIIQHTGRKSGQPYENPVWALRRGDTLAIALVYGADSDWVKNVIAAGGCRAKFASKTLTLTNPTIVHDPTRKNAPALARPILRLMNVDDGLELTIAPPNPEQPAPRETSTD